MDYARYNYVAQPGDGAALMPKVGPYDDFAVNWGYRVLPGDLTPEQEQDSLQAWIRVQDANPMLRFGRQQWMTVDPSAQMEDLGDDAVKASTLGIANLKRIMGYLVEATTTSGKDYDLL
ncbi:MAG: zinc-dependent metalloprotease, partial [Candidatus Kapaibacterium sp.]